MQVGPKKDLIVIIKWPIDLMPSSGILTPIVALPKVTLIKGNNGTEMVHPNHGN